MKKGRILNKELNETIAGLGHTDLVIICDAGFPIPDHVKRIDLALQKDDPDIVKILELLISDFIYEKVIVAEEQKKCNQPLYQKICALCDRCEVETIPHADLIRQMPSQAKVIIRTGAFEPWGNVLLYSGVDAPRWFDKEGTVIPDYYEKRANYQEKES